jgi:hypothetical protein
MKKLFYTLVLCMMMFCSTALAGCGKGNLVSVGLQEHTVDKVVLLNEDLDLAGLKLNLTYENGKTEEITGDTEGVTVTGFDKRKVGSQTITITYKSFSVKVDVYVTADENETFEIKGFEKPTFYTNYEGHRDATGDTAHFVVGDTYKVGDDNEFVFVPEITAIKEIEGELPIDIVLDKYISTVKVELKEGNTYTELTDDLEDYVVVDNANSSFEFVDDVATGETFRITVQPYVESDVDPITFTVEVVDGWNAYTAMDLSRIDNCVNTADAWATLKNGGYNEDIKGIVLHDNMKLTTSVLPSNYFQQLPVEGGEAGETETAMVGWKSMYTREIPTDEEFVIYGNYFSIDASELPLSPVREQDAYGHSAIFSFGGDNDGGSNTAYATTALQGDARIVNLKLIGNAQRTEDVKYAGGLTCINTTAETLTIENSIIRKFTNHVTCTEMTNTTEDDDNTVVFVKTKLIDAYSLLSYVARTNEVYIDSLLKGSGGPALMGSHWNPEGKVEAHADITLQNTEVDAHVVGDEAWFVANGAADMAAQIKALDQIFTTISSQLKTFGMVGSTKSIMNPEKENKINFLSVLMVEGDPLSNPYPIKGTFTVKDAEGNVLSSQDMTDVLGIVAKNGGAYKANFFFKSNGVMMMFNGDMSNPGVLLLTENALKFPTTPEEMTLQAGDIIDVAALLTDAAMIAQMTPEQIGAAVQGGTLTMERVQQAQTYAPKVAQFFEGDYLHLYVGPVLGMSVDFVDVPMPTPQA